MVINKGYKTYGSYHCLIGCVQNYCIYYGIPVTGEDIFFYGKGYEIKYELKEDNSFTLKLPINYMQVFNEFGILCKSSKVQQTGDDLKQILIGLVEAESALIIKMNSKKINYDIIFARNRSTFHFINLVGYDSINDKFCVSDSFIPAYEPFHKQLWIEAKEFLDMWDDNTEILLLDCSKEIPRVPLDIRHTIIQQLENYLCGRVEKNMYYGKLAIRKLICDIEALLVKNWDIDLIKEINFQLRVKGFFMGREYLCSYLEKNGYNDLANALWEIVNKWKKICLILTKCVMTKKEDKLHEILSEAVSLCDAEEQLLLQIIYKLG